MLSRLGTLLWFGLTVGLLAYYTTRLEMDEDPGLYYQVAGQVLHRNVNEADLQKRRGDAAAPRPAVVATDGRRLPYRDFTVEYPPLALGILTLPRVFADRPVPYLYCFQGMMAAAYLATTILLARLFARLRPEVRCPTRWAFFLATLLLVLTGSYVVRRFDILPSLTVAIATLAMVTANPFTAGLFLGTGVALKLWPVLLLPLLLMYDRRPRPVARLLLGLAVLPLLSHLVLWPSVGPSVLNYLSFHAGRGLQLESLWASLLMPLAKVLHLPLDAILSHGSMNLWSPDLVGLVMPISNILTIGMLLACYAVGHVALRHGEADSRPKRLAEVIVLLVASLIITAKVFSPQYLLWLFPLVLLVSERRIVVVYLLAIAFTHLYFPYHYDDVISMTKRGMSVLLIRNLLVVALVAMLFRSLVKGYRATAKPGAAGSGAARTKTA